MYVTYTNTHAYTSTHATHIHTPKCVTSIALTNANNCQNQGKGCSTPTPTRLVDILQRAFEKKGHQSTGAGRGGLDAADLGQRVAGFHQDVTVRGELREVRNDYLGGGRACHRSRADGPRRHVGRTPEEDNEQRDGAQSADVRHLARLSRLNRVLTFATDAATFNREFLPLPPIEQTTFVVRSTREALACRSPFETMLHEGTDDPASS